MSCEKKPMTFPSLSRERLGGTKAGVRGRLPMGNV
jgi:hypothetical protein